MLTMDFISAILRFWNSKPIHRIIMTKARCTQISLDDTPFYHCYTRCVHRAFLCGVDRETGDDFEHRIQWLVMRMKQLASVFLYGCLCVCGDEQSLSCCSTCGYRRSHWCIG